MALASLSVPLALGALPVESVSFVCVELILVNVSDLLDLPNNEGLSFLMEKQELLFSLLKLFFEEYLVLEFLGENNIVSLLVNLLKVCLCIVRLDLDSVICIFWLSSYCDKPLYLLNSCRLYEFQDPN